uniref:thymidine kinase n=1 Tax=viral metagenome TaxID=1070528 RepID=A0A6C0DTY6_9ZZZZ
MGYISLIIGCMFSQKTTELLRRVRRYKSIGYKVLVVNYIGDNRYGKDCVSSHDKDVEKAACVELLKSVNHLVRSGDYNVVAIDEGQFFTDLYEYVSTWADELPIHIVVSGLDGTSERTPFGDMLKLIPHAEEVERLSAFCSVCRDGTVAVYSKYFGEVPKDENGVAIGGAEAYRPVCRKHFLNSK